MTGMISSAICDHVTTFSVEALNNKALDFRVGAHACMEIRLARETMLDHVQQVRTRTHVACSVLHAAHRAAYLIVIVTRSIMPQSSPLSVPLPHALMVANQKQATANVS